jgi:putative oxidoreductase
MKVIVLLGRILFSLLFLINCSNMFTPMAVQYAAAQGVPIPNILVPLAAVIAIVGAVSIAIGLKARFGGWLIVLFLIPVTFFMHRFWNEKDPMAYQMQKGLFLHNLALTGAAFLVSYFGAGPWSFDAKKEGYE